MGSNRQISVFDVIGPIMVGPSSSHTAGAVRLGMVGRALLGCTPQVATIELHGSFAETGTGHGTDKAILAGLLGMTPQDNRLKDSMEIAESSGLKFEFRHIDLGDNFHPNSCRITLAAGNETIQYIGSSIGGGMIEIVELEHYPVSFNAELDCLIVIANDQPGTINMITGWLYNHQVNVAFFAVDRQQKGGRAIMTIQTDQSIPEMLAVELRTLPWIHWARVIRRIED